VPAQDCLKGNAYNFEVIGGSLMDGDEFILNTLRPLADVRGVRDVDQYGPCRLCDAHARAASRTDLLS
jgi:hypothetical protein